LTRERGALVQQFFHVDPIGLCPSAASVDRNRGRIDHMAFDTVRLQEAVYPETIKTGFVDRNNSHRFVPQYCSARAFSCFNGARRAVVSPAGTWCLLILSPPLFQGLGTKPA
jgi:hypothetical protein